MKNFQFKAPYTLRDGRQIEMRAHASLMKTLLGLPLKSKLPAQGMEPRVIQGVKVWVEPAPDPVFINKWGRTRLLKRSTHRVMAECPDCGKHLSAGRMHQHVCKAK